MAILAVEPVESARNRSVRLQRRADGQLWLVSCEPPCAVRPVRCFPWSRPGQFLSLRDADDAERDFIDDVDQLEAASRAAIEASLRDLAMVLAIDDIHSVVEEVEIRTWHVVTSAGPRRLQTARDEWPRELADGSFLLRDVAGDLYRVPAPERLGPTAQRFLWAFV